MIRLALSQESIAFQSTALFKELVLGVEAAMKVSKKDLPDSEEISGLAAIIKHHTNMTIIFDIGNHQPHIQIPPVNKNHPLVSVFHRNFTSSAMGMAELGKNGGLISGSVSMLNNKVSGVFAEFPGTIALPAIMFMGTKYTGEEIAAIIGHEMGHLYTYFEYIARTVTTNQVLSAMSKDLDGSGSVEERENVLITVKKHLKLSEMDAGKLARSTDKRVIEAVVITNIIRETKTELGSNIYDSTTWEFLSDQYATRIGAGRPLVSALNKLYGGSFNISFRSLPVYLLMEALKILTLINPFVFIALCALDGNGDNSYDRPGARMMRIRSDIVQGLKDKSLTDDDIERMNADIKVIDSVMVSINDRRQFVSVLWDALIPSARKDRNYENMQKELEAIAANDLFVLAAEFKTLKF